MLAALLAAALAQVTPPSGSPSARSAIVVVLDDVSTFDLATWGGPVPTPNLDALAARGVRFDAAYANPTCAATRRSLLFGHWWVTDSGPPCAPANAHSPALGDRCIARLVPQRALLVGKWHLGGSPLGGDDLLAPLDHGFQHWIAGAQANVNDCGGLNYSRWRRVEDGVASTSLQYEPTALRDRVVFWWNATPGARLMVVNFALAHGPMHAPPPELLPPGYPVPVSARARFEAMILAADNLLGQILEHVGPDDLAIVIGDNGTPINVSPDPDRSKTTTFERGIRVPLVIAGGAVASPGRSSGELVHAVDVWGTLMDWLGGTPPDDPAHPLAGVSLLPSLGDSQPHSYHDYIVCGNRWGGPGGDRCARSLGFKLRQMDDDGDKVPDREEFYVLSADPTEQTDRISDPTLTSVIEAHRSWLRGSAP